ncbi:hypothetical protein ACF0H5_008938 [Mactra antiquata]
MERFSIEYITRNLQQDDCSTDAVIQVSNHDGLLTHGGSNFLHTSLHLEDVYSVISKDVDHVTSPLVNDVTNHVTQHQMTDLTQVDSRYNSLDDGTSPLPSPEEVSAVILNDVTPLASPSEVNKSHDRNTPSPQKDSGIDSDNSPVSSADVEKKLNVLEKKAKSIQPKSSSKKSSSSEKPPHSYIALIAQAILATRDRKCALGEIYRHIAETYQYYNNEEKAWRNSIRYNLSINECFVKAGKDESTGKGNLWAIHPACVEDFEKGDYRRRQARRRARRTLKGMKSPDTDLLIPAHTAQYNYQPMTPSYVTYHPYSTPAYTSHQQYQRTDSDNTYNGQTYPQGAYYDNQYPQVSQYSAMSTTGQIPSGYGYTQSELSYLHRPYGYDSVEFKSENNVVQTDDTASKWYTNPAESIPENNTVVIA